MYGAVTAKYQNSIDNPENSQNKALDNTMSRQPLQGKLTNSGK